MSHKIGILTYHDGFNHGGYFQAYFLQEYLKSKGHDVFILNYKNISHFINEYRYFLLQLNFIKFFKNLYKIISFNNDQRKFNKLPKYITFSENKISSISSKLDYIVVGSDIVWDYDYKFTGPNNIYFGEYLSPIKGLISYSASMGRTKSSIPMNFRKLLEKFNYISVRDDNTQKILEEYTNVNSTKTLDPTLITDIHDIGIKLDEKKFLETKYLLVYAFFLPYEFKSNIKKIAIEKNLKIVSVGYHQDFVDINCTEVGPFMWLKAFRDAEFIVTSTFHGSIFSILFNKLFITVANDSIESKVVSLLNDLRIIDRYISSATMINVLLRDIDYCSVSHYLKKLRINSINYLDSVFSSKN